MAKDHDPRKPAPEEIIKSMKEFPADAEVCIDAFEKVKQDTHYDGKAVRFPLWNESKKTSPATKALQEAVEKFNVVTKSEITVEVKKTKPLEIMRRQPQNMVRVTVPAACVLSPV